MADTTADRRSEFAAMAALDDLLAPFPREVRIRIINWASQKYIPEEYEGIAEALDRLGDIVDNHRRRDDNEPWQKSLGVHP
mgnify:FL=1